MSADARIGNRIEYLDVLRGFALTGVCAANLFIFAGLSYMTDAERAALPTAAFDRVATMFELVFIETKFMGLFAMLFGASFWLFLDRASARGREGQRSLLPPHRLALRHRRAPWMAVLVFRRPSVLCALGCAAAAVSDGVAADGASARARVQCAGARGRGRLPIGLVHAGERRRCARCARPPGLRTRHVCRDAARQLDLRLVSDALAGADLVSGGAIRPDGAGPVRGACADPGRIVHARQPCSRRTAIAGGPRRRDRQHRDGHPRADAGRLAASSIAFVAGFIEESGYLALSIAYASTLALLCQSPRWMPVLRRFAPIGQMALTCYLSQTLVALWLFYGFMPGPHLMGHVGGSVLLAICAVWFAIQASLASVWLGRYRYGPMEWVWRSLTYWEVQPRQRLDLRESQS